MLPVEILRDVVDEGSFLDVIISHPDASATPPVSDLSRYKIPLGVVAVHSASHSASGAAWTRLETRGSVRIELTWSLTVPAPE
ncbi:hypothetical protein GCM10018987_19170 [Streptomyces cremeus]